MKTVIHLLIIAVTLAGCRRPLPSAPTSEASAGKDLAAAANAEFEKGEFWKAEKQLIQF